MRPTRVGDPEILKGDRTLQKYFKTAAFAAPTGGRCIPGDTGRNILTGPGYVNADLSLSKDFGITEHAKLETRFEFFNTTNTPHFSNPMPTLDQALLSDLLRELTITNGSSRSRQRLFSESRPIWVRWRR
jgi:hypothetical protein